MGNNAEVNAAETSAAEQATTFTKAQLLKCTRYSHRKDALSVLLKDDERYTHEEVFSNLRRRVNG